MESSVPGLHFLGAPAAWSFGPIMRFVSGGWYTGRALVRTIAGPSRLPGPAEPAPVPASAGQAP
jgi:FAD-dependent urate hydroxylase